MLNAWQESLAQIMEANVWLAPLVALLGGLLTAANPCVLAAAPLMVGYVAGQEQRTIGRSFFLSMTFTLGLTVTFGLMWFSVLTASSIMPATWWQYVAATVCLLMGLHLLGVLQLRIPAPTGMQPKRRGFVGALLLGMLFGLISMPCAGPVLAALLVITPLYGVALGVTLLVSYSIGHCGLVLIGGTSIGLVQKLADSKGWSRGTDILRRVGGALIVLVGVWILL